MSLNTIENSTKQNIKYGINNTKNILSVPKINLHQEIIKADDNFSNLNYNLVYYKYLNPEDRIIIFGHSGTGYGTYFNRIDELDENDIAYLYLKSGTFKYTIKSIYLISKYDVYILDNKPKNGDLLLITCYKKNKNKRYVVELSLKPWKINKKKHFYRKNTCFILIKMLHLNCKQDSLQIVHKEMEV